MVMIKDTATALSIAIAGCGVWWAGFAIGPARRLKRRPGPPLAGGVWASIRYSWRQTWGTLQQVRRLSGTAEMLFLWFIYADGSSAILQTAVLIVSSEIDTGCLGLQVVLAILFVEVQIVGGLGCFVMERAATKYGLSDKTVILGCLTVFVLVSIYCLFGFVSDDYGLHTAPDLFVVTLFVAFAMVPITSQSRSLFATMIPRGLESQFFALYGITDKVRAASSWRLAKHVLCFCACCHAVRSLLWGPSSSWSAISIELTPSDSTLFTFRVAAGSARSCSPRSNNGPELVATCSSGQVCSAWSELSGFGAWMSLKPASRPLPTTKKS